MDEALTSADAKRNMESEQVVLTALRRLLAEGELTPPADSHTRTVELTTPALDEH